VAAELRELLAPALDQADAEGGPAWWNFLSESERAAMLKAANTAVPAEAWAHWRRSRGLSALPALECECGNKYGFVCPVHGAAGVQP
jgi:hypothetical protein